MPGQLYSQYIHQLLFWYYSIGVSSMQERHKCFHFPVRSLSCQTLICMHVWYHVSQSCIYCVFIASIASGRLCAVSIHDYAVHVLHACLHYQLLSRQHSIFDGVCNKQCIVQSAAVVLLGFAMIQLLQNSDSCAKVKGFHKQDMTKPEDHGFIASRPRGEYNANQQMARLLHKSIVLRGKKAGVMVHYHPFDLLWFFVVVCASVAPLLGTQV